MIERCRRALTKQYNLVTPAVVNTGGGRYESRLVKYAKRGYRVSQLL